MLVLTISVDGRVFIGDNIVLTLCEVSRSGRQARIAFQAPTDVKILREEKLPDGDKRKNSPRNDLKGTRRAKTRRR